MTAIQGQMSTKIFLGSEGHYLLASNLPLSHLTYDITQSHMVCCGFKGHRDAPFAASDAAALSSVLVERGLVEQSKVRLCSDEGECTTEAMKSAFKTKAGSVGENGVLLFAYHGPALASDSTPSLVSSNYRPDNAATHVTSATILKWLEELGSSKPKQMLFFLDCQLASEIAAHLVGSPPLAGIENICVFCANTPAHSSLLSTSLQHSAFTYFAVWAFMKYTQRPEQSAQRLIYIKDISDNIRACCVALNSLCVSEMQSNSTAPAAVSVRVQPLKLALLQRSDDDRFGEIGEDETDGSEFARFRFLQKYHRAGRKNNLKMCELGLEWLQYLKHNEASPLHVFRDLHLLSRSELLITLLRVMLYRLALVQESRVQHSTKDPNTLIILYMQAASVIEHVASTEVGANVDQFLLAVEAYCLALQQQHIKSSKIEEFAKKIEKDNPRT